jgi:hypothetical protein
MMTLFYRRKKTTPLDKNTILTIAGGYFYDVIKFFLRASLFKIYDNLHRTGRPIRINCHTCMDGPLAYGPAHTRMGSNIQWATTLLKSVTLPGTTLNCSSAASFFTP